MTGSLDRWDPSEIPEFKRRSLSVDGDGFLTLHLKPTKWITPGQARDRVMQAFRIDAAAASDALRLRLISGHVVASAGGVFGPARKRERMKIAGGRDFVGNALWQYLKLDETLWTVGDLQAVVVGTTDGDERIVTYTDVRFMEANINKIVAISRYENADKRSAGVEPAAAAAALTEEAQPARRRGRTIGTGKQKEDSPLVAEIIQLHRDGGFPSLTKAAESVAHRATGLSREAIVRRLVRAAKLTEINGG